MQCNVSAGSRVGIRHYNIRHWRAVVALGGSTSSKTRCGEAKIVGQVSSDAVRAGLTAGGTLFDAGSQA